MIYTESEMVELKSVYVDSIKKEIVAFANTHGGTIYIGVEDDGEVCGIDHTDLVTQQVMNAARDAIKPDVTMFMHIESISENGKLILAVQVQCGAHRPYYLAAKTPLQRQARFRADTLLPPQPRGLRAQPIPLRVPPLPPSDIL